MKVTSLNVSVYGYAAFSNFIILRFVLAFLTPSFCKEEAVLLRRSVGNVVRQVLNTYRNFAN